MRQVFGEWGVVTETKSTSYGILSAPVASTIKGISHIVSEPVKKRFHKMHVAICGNVFLQAQGNAFDIHSITIGDILFGALNRQIFEFENPSPVLSKKDSLRNQILFFATKRTCAASPCMKVSCSAPMVLPQLPTAFVIQALTPSYSSVYGGSTSLRSDTPFGAVI